MAVPHPPDLEFGACSSVVPGASTSIRSPLRLAGELLSLLNSRDVRYALLGAVRPLVDSLKGDLDIVVESSSLRRVPEELAAFGAIHGVHLVQVLQHEQSAWYFVLAWYDESRKLRFLHPDICGDYYRHGRLFLTAEELLEGRMLARNVDFPGPFYLPRPALNFIYYLLKKIDKGELNYQQGAYLSDLWSADPLGAARQSIRFWPPAEANFICHAAEIRDWEPVQPRLAELRSTLRRRIPRSARSLVGEVRRIADRIVRPTGVAVVFLGPDGAGKSTVIGRVQRSLAPAFRRTHGYHLRPGILGRRGSAHPVTAPHADPPRGVIVSTLKLAYWWVDYTVGYLIAVLPRLIKSTLVLFDRYYLDIEVDAKRYRYGGPRWVARLLRRIIPHPRLMIVLNVPTSELERRKRELPEVELAHQAEAYRRLIRGLPGGHIVDASRQPDCVVTEVEHVVLAHLEQRTARRLKLGRVNPSTESA